MKIRFLRVGVASCGIAAGADKVFEKLKEKGFNLARRTVAKYRQQLGIPVARMRR